MYRAKPILFHILWIIIFLISSAVFADDYTLPLYELEIDAEHLGALDRDPKSSNTYPASVWYNDRKYECRVRYRGASARTLSKKSWKFFFDNLSPQGRDVLNLNSEYRDISLNHNFLSLKLAEIIGLQAPTVRHVSLTVNGDYHGVYIEIENIDEQYFEVRDHYAAELFKAPSHASRFAPTLKSSDQSIIYEPKFTSPGSIDTLGKRLAFFYYTSPGSNIEELNRIIDVDNFIKYFALMYSICNYDGFAKNFYIWRRDDNRYQLIPWDCDGTFGNDWQGNFIGFEHVKTFALLYEQSVFQHIIAIPQYRDRMHEMIDFIVNDGFQQVQSILFDNYNLIRHDVKLDTSIRGDIAEFEAEQNNFYRFMDLRRDNLKDLDWFYRFEVKDVKITPEYDNGVDSLCKFEVQFTDVPQRALVGILDSSYAEVQILLNDSGENGDRISGDRIYTVEFPFADYILPLSFGVLIEFRRGDYFTHPSAGWHLLGQRRYPLPILYHISEPPLYGDIAIGKVKADLAGTFILPIVNLSESSMDISGCQIRLGSNYRRLTLPQLDPINAGDTLYITNHLEQARYYLPSGNILPGFYFVPNLGDTLRLFSPGGNLLAENLVSSIDYFVESFSGIVINEIKYKSDNDFDTGDWIELFTSQENIDLSNFKLTDNDSDHVYIIPDSTLLAPSSYLVIARNPEKFAKVHPELEDVIGGFDFGFSSSFDDVKLLDEQGKLVDWVSYSNGDPWPDLSVKKGTLELINSELTNFSAENWRASGERFPLGTPGKVNFQSGSNQDYPDLPYITDYKLISVWPNPFNEELQVSYSAPEMGTALFTLYDINGRQVAKFNKFNISAGSFKANVEFSKSSRAYISAGSYFLRIEGLNSDSFMQVIYLP